MPLLLPTLPLPLGPRCADVAAATPAVPANTR